MANIENVMVLKEYKLNRIEDIQKQIYLDDFSEGIFPIKELIFNNNVKEKYIKEKDRLNRTVYFKIDENYLTKQKVTTIIDTYNKCNDLGIDYLILPLNYCYKALTMEAYCILAQKINSILTSNLIAHTQILIENVNQEVKELAYLIEALQARIKLLLNIDALEYKDLIDLRRDLQKFDLLNHIQLIKTKKYSLNIRDMEENEEFNKFILEIINNKVNHKTENELRVVIN